MNPAFILIIILFFIPSTESERLEGVREKKINFPIDKQGLFENRIQMFYSMLNSDHVPVECENNMPVNFQHEILPMDIYKVYENKGNEEYYSLLTKTIYGLPQHISYFTPERLSDEEYLREVMPSNKIKKVNDYYELEVGFGAPDITFKIDFYSNEELNEQFPELIKYFKQNDLYENEPTITSIQHNYKYTKIMGQKTSKMSVSVSRYFNEGDNGTLVMNYTLNYIHNLPPRIFGGADMIVNQMEKGMLALVEDTRNAFQ